MKAASLQSHQSLKNAAMEVILGKNKEILEDYEILAPRHFSSKEMPGQADDVFHDCIKKVKAEAKKDGKDMTEQEAAAICTKSRKEGGATQKFGAKRKAEVDHTRKKDKTANENLVFEFLDYAVGNDLTENSSNGEELILEAVEDLNELCLAVNEYLGYGNELLEYNPKERITRAARALHLRAARRGEATSDARHHVKQMYMAPSKEDREQHEKEYDKSTAKVEKSIERGFDHEYRIKSALRKLREASMSDLGKKTSDAVTKIGRAKSQMSKRVSAGTMSPEEKLVAGRSADRKIATIKTRDPKFHNSLASSGRRFRVGKNAPFTNKDPEAIAMRKNVMDYEKNNPKGNWAGD